jgi:hypothetical protein
MRAMLCEDAHSSSEDWGGETEESAVNSGVMRICTRQWL